VTVFNYFNLFWFLSVAAWANTLLPIVREILPPPTAWMLDLLDLTLRLGPLVRSWLSFSFHTWPSVAARVHSLQGCFFAATRSDKHGVLQSWIHQQFYNRPHNFFITWHDYYRQIEECRV